MAHSMARRVQRVGKCRILAQPAGSKNADAASGSQMSAAAVPHVRRAHKAGWGKTLAASSASPQQHLGPWECRGPAAITWRGPTLSPRSASPTPQCHWQPVSQFPHKLPAAPFWKPQKFLWESNKNVWVCPTRCWRHCSTPPLPIHLKTGSPFLFAF